MVKLSLRGEGMIYECSLSIHKAERIIKDIIERNEKERVRSDVPIALYWQENPRETQCDANAADAN